MSDNDIYVFVLDPITTALSRMKPEFGVTAERWADGDISGGEMVAAIRAESYSSGEKRLAHFLEALWTGDGAKATLDDFSSLSDLEAVFESIRRARQHLNW